MRSTGLLLNRMSRMSLVVGGATASAVVMVAMVIIGCDRGPAAPPPTAKPPTASTAPAVAEARPTTQQLLSGPYQTITLPGMPLVVSAPQGWKLDLSSAPLTFLAGPTPSSDKVLIQLAQHDTVKVDQIEIIANFSKKPQNDEIQRAELRDVGKMKVVERLAFGKPETTPKVDAKGQPVLDDKGQIITVTSTPVHWQIIAFVPYQGLFSRYDLNVIDLTTDQYAKDKDVLEKIVNSLRYEGDAGNAAVPTTTSASR
jgi:hypothetical protein